MEEKRKSKLFYSMLTIIAYALDVPMQFFLMIWARKQNKCRLRHAVSLSSWPVIQLAHHEISFQIGKKDEA